LRFLENTRSVFYSVKPACPFELHSYHYPQT
jgi:hypothetical protein